MVVYSILAERNSIQDGDKERQGKEMPILKQASLSLSIPNMMLILNNLYSQYIIYHLWRVFLIGEKGETMINQSLTTDRENNSLELI